MTARTASNFTWREFVDRAEREESLANEVNDPLVKKFHKTVANQYRRLAYHIQSQSI